MLAIDYRGFGDSTGTPSEAGLLLDARAAWDYVSSHLGKDSAEDKVLLIGQSLGTGVVAGLAGQLADERPLRFLSSSRVDGTDVAVC